MKDAKPLYDIIRGENKGVPLHNESNSEKLARTRRDNTRLSGGVVEGTPLKTIEASPSSGVGERPTIAEAADHTKSDDDQKSFSLTREILKGSKESSRSSDARSKASYLGRRMKRLGMTLLRGEVGGKSDKQEFNRAYHVEAIGTGGGIGVEIGKEKGYGAIELEGKVLGWKGNTAIEAGKKGMILHMGQEIGSRNVLREAGHIMGQTVWKEGMSGQMAIEYHIGGWKSAEGVTTGETFWRKDQRYGWKASTAGKMLGFGGGMSGGVLVWDGKRMGSGMGGMMVGRVGKYELGGGMEVSMGLRGGIKGSFVMKLGTMEFRSGEDSTGFLSDSSWKPADE